MTETDRRKFLAVAGAGTAAGVVSMTAGPALAGSTSGKAAKESVVAIVSDHRSDSLTLLVGEREVTVRNRDLVRRILDAAGGK